MLAYTFSAGEVTEGVEVVFDVAPCPKGFVHLGGKQYIPLDEEDFTTVPSWREVMNVKDGKGLMEIADVVPQLDEVYTAAFKSFAKPEDFVSFVLFRRGKMLYGGRLLVRVVTTPIWSLVSATESLVKALREFHPLEGIDPGCKRTSFHPLCLARMGSPTDGDYLFVFRELDILCFQNTADPDYTYVLIARSVPPYLEFYRGK